MKKEQKIQVFAAAEKMCLKYDDVKVATFPRVIDSPDAYWVSAWIRVPLTAAKAPDPKQRTICPDKP